MLIAFYKSPLPQAPPLCAYHRPHSPGRDHVLGSRAVNAAGRWDRGGTCHHICGAPLAIIKYPRWWQGWQGLTAHSFVPCPCAATPTVLPRVTPPGVLGHRLPLPISPGCHTQTHCSLLCTLCSQDTKGSQMQSKGSRTRCRILVEGSGRGLSPCPPHRSQPRIPACHTLLPASRSSLDPIALGGISPRPGG